MLFTCLCELLLYYYIRGKRVVDNIYPERRVVYNDELQEMEKSKPLALEFHPIVKHIIATSSSPESLTK